MDSSESKDGNEAGANSLSRPLRCRSQSPHRELRRVSPAPARRLTITRGELNRERDDASASGGGGAGAAHGDPAALRTGHGAKVLGAFAGSKNDVEEFPTEQRFLAAKGCKNDGVESLATGRMFLAAKGCKNDEAESLATGRMFLAGKGSKKDGAEFLGTGQRFLTAKRYKNDGAEAEEVLGAFAVSKKAKTVKVPAAAERIDGAVLGGLAEKAAATFFEASPAVPHTVTEKRKLPSPSLVASVSRATSHSKSNCHSTSLIASKDLQVKELKTTENELDYDLLWQSVEKHHLTEKHQELAKAKTAPAAPEQKAPQYEHMDKANNNDLKNCAEVQEKTQNELEDDLLCKGLDASSRRSEAVTMPHPLCKRATIELVETKEIQDPNFVQNWLLENERESDENYFMKIATDEKKKMWQRVKSCPDVFGQKFSGRRLTSLNMVIDRKDMLFLCHHMKNSGSRIDIGELAQPNTQCLSEIIKFLCRNCLLRNVEADRVALEMLCEAVKDTSDYEAIGDLPGFIATVVLKSFIGNAVSQRLSLQILISLSRRYRNKLKIIKLGGFRSAIWHVSQQHCMMGCQLMASLMDAEEGLLKFIKDGEDGASFQLVNLAVKTGYLTPCISSVIESLRDFPFGRARFIGAVSHLSSKEIFIQQRLIWCLLDFVEQDQRYRNDDTLED